MNTRLLVGCLAVTCFVGCGKSAEEKRAEEAAAQIQQGAAAMQQGAQQMQQSAQQSADQMAQGLQQMAQGFQQMAQGSGNVVDFEALKLLLPEVDGWSKGESRGEQLSMPVKDSRAQTTYERADSRIELELTDTALSQLLLAPMSMFLASGYSERSDDGFKRAAKVAGHPGIEEWNLKSKRGEVTAVVNNRFIVHATGRDVDSLDPVRKAVEAVDLGKLAALK